MTLIGVKTRRMRNLYVLIVLAPGSRTKICARFESRRPWAPAAVGETVRAGRRRLRVTAIRTMVTRLESTIEHRTILETRAVRIRRTRKAPPNVVAMPVGDSSVVANFLRYHVLIRVYDGNPDAWLAQLVERGDDRSGDARFVRWIRSRLRKEPSLLGAIRKMVDDNPLWSSTAS